MKYLLAALLTVTLSTPSSAYQLCKEGEFIKEQLAKKYQELSTAFAITSDGGLLEVMINPNKSTWTIIVTYQTGTSCLLAYGEAWRTYETAKSKLDPET